VNRESRSSPNNGGGRFFDYAIMEWKGDKDRYDQMAREELPEEEYQKVQHLLEIRTHTTE